MWAVLLGVGAVEVGLWASKLEARDDNQWWFLVTGIGLVWWSGYARARDAQKK